MNWTLRDIAKETGCPLHTVKRLFYSSRTVFEPFISRGKRSKVLLDNRGKAELLKLILDQFANGSAPVTENCSGNQERELVDNGSRTVQLLQDTILELRNDLAREREERTKLQEAMLEAQQRHDTIVMSITNQLKEIRLALPAPPQEAEKQESQPSPGPLAVLRSVWRDFVGWLDSPYPQKA